MTLLHGVRYIQVETAETLHQQLKTVN